MRDEMWQRRSAGGGEEKPGLPRRGGGRWGEGREREEEQAEKRDGGSR